MSTTADRITELQSEIKSNQEFLSLLRAHEEGATIQGLQVNTGEWVTRPIFAWDSPSSHYRIKPEPKVVYVNEYEDYRCTHDKKETALEMTNCDCVRKAVRYIEDIEEG